MNFDYTDLEAHNAKVRADADAACRQYYVDNPEGNWYAAHAISEAILADLVSIPCGGWPVYP